ncbi:MAG: hypothetical protein HY676_01015 [Chloroflexi bacterium]|nr:hypothetical protein [Chloroflexota bacterium]
MGEGLDEILHYINSLRRMGISPGTERRVLREVYSHLEEEVRELEATGMPQEEAVHQAVAQFGPPRDIAQSMADIYARSSLREALAGAAPHFLIALTFLFHLWQRPSWVVFLATLTGGLALYGWGRGKPAWFYPWLGYSLAATLSMLFSAMLLAGWSVSRLLDTPGMGWGLWVVVGAYVPLALGILVAVAGRVAQQDWLHVSLMFLPLPVLAGWALRLQQQDKLLEQGRYRLQDMDPGMAVILAVLALSVIAFLRLRRRLLKISLLLSTTVGVLIVLSLSQGVPLNFLGFVLVASALAVFLLSPALLDHHGDPKEEPWASIHSEEPLAQGWRRAV